MKQTLLCAIAIVMLCACRQTSMFYNPEAVISLRNEVPMDTVHGYGGEEIFSPVKRICCIDRKYNPINSSSFTLKYPVDKDYPLPLDFVKTVPKILPVSEESDLLLDNVEALAQGEEAIYYDKVVLCLRQIYYSTM